VQCCCDSHLMGVGGFDTPERNVNLDITVPWIPDSDAVRVVTYLVREYRLQRARKCQVVKPPVWRVGSEER